MKKNDIIAGQVTSALSALRADGGWTTKDGNM